MVLQKCREEKLTLNEDKYKISQPTVKFFGHELSTGLPPSRDLIQSVVEVTTPQTKEDVHRLIGFGIYLSKFCPKLSEETNPLREVLRKNTQFFWEEPQQEAFRKGKDITLTVDASSTSLGAALFQDGGLVECAAKALKLAHISYAQIEKRIASYSIWL